MQFDLWRPPMTRWFVNPAPGAPGIVVLPSGGYRRARAAITGWDGYAPTPLHDLSGVAGIDTVRIKDEAGRFGLGSFKALGGAYAVEDVVAAELARRGGGVPADLTVTCATDGNHGRSVAWGAQRVGARCVVFVHAEVSGERVAAMERWGASVRRAGADYDESVRAANDAAASEGWLVVSDTSWPGYTEVPRLVMQGYRLMVDEALDEWTGAPPSHVFIQAGVGGAAASVAVQLRARLATMPRVVVVEPLGAACLLRSAEQGTATKAAGKLDTIMACLACGEPSLLAWQELERSAAAFLAIEDAAAVGAMRRLATLGIVSGESGAAGLAGLLVAVATPALREALALTADSRVLLFSTEGATDPARYAELVGSGEDAA